jgi:DNA-binding NtrC family response regulator
MPDVDGLELLDHIENCNPALARRLQFISADDGGPFAIIASRRTGCPVLQKPFDWDDLLKACKELLARK